MSDPTAIVRRYLRQRAELGERELFLDTLTPELVRALAARGALAAAGPELEPARPPAPATSSAAAAASAAPPPRPPRAETPVPGASSAAAPPAVAPPHVQVEATQLLQLGSLDALRDAALGCPRCRLCETRHHVVFGEGSGTADLMVVGEAPGAEEDRTGRPFVGRAGKLLDLLLASVGFARETVYICNVLKCRPPANRNPEPEEIEACSPFLRRQVELVRPRAILAVGGFAAQTLLGSTTSIGQLRGRVHDYGGIPLVPSYHPAALLRNPVWVRPVWEDLQRLRSVLDEH